MANKRRRRPRQGLSTLELVLCLPILLFLMALMINFGVVACWKVRALSMARDAAWQNRASRGGYSYLPDYWPQGASVGVGAAGDVPELGDVRVDHPVVRGPFLAYGASVDRELLDPARGLREGSAELTRRFALMASMGAYRLEAHSLLLDDKWQHGEMGLGSSYTLRMPTLYRLPTAPAAYKENYVQAVEALNSAGYWEVLRVLDRDDEYVYYRQRFGWPVGSPSFRPSLGSFCSLERSAAQQQLTRLTGRIEGSVKRDANGRITERIPGVPERMTSSLRDLYRRVIAQLEQESLPDPPPPAVQAEIRDLQARIDVLTAFLQIVQARHAN